MALTDTARLESCQRAVIVVRALGATVQTEMLESRTEGANEAGAWGTSWIRMMRPWYSTGSCPSGRSSTSTCTPEELGRSSTGIGCTARHLNLTVLSLSTLRRYLKDRDCFGALSSDAGGWTLAWDRRGVLGLSAQLVATQIIRRRYGRRSGRESVTSKASTSTGKSI